MRRFSRTFQLVLLRPIYFFYAPFAFWIGKLWLDNAPAKRKVKACVVFCRKLRTKTSFSISNKERIARYDFWILFKNVDSDSSRLIQKEDNYEKYIEKNVTFFGNYKGSEFPNYNFSEAWAAERFKTIKLHHYAYTDFYPIPFSSPGDIELILKTIYDDHKRRNLFLPLAVDTIVGLIGVSSARNTMLEATFLSHLLPQLVQEKLLEEKSSSGFTISGKGITYLKELKNQRLTHKENAKFAKQHNFLVFLLVIVGVVANWDWFVSLFLSAL